MSLRGSGSREEARRRLHHPRPRRRRRLQRLRLRLRRLRRRRGRRRLTMGSVEGEWEWSLVFPWRSCSLTFACDDCDDTGSDGPVPQPASLRIPASIRVRITRRFVWLPQSYILHLLTDFVLVVPVTRTCTWKGPLGHGHISQLSSHTSGGELIVCRRHSSHHVFLTAYLSLNPISA